METFGERNKPLQNTGGNYQIDLGNKYKFAGAINTLLN